MPQEASHGLFKSDGHNPDNCIRLIVFQLIHLITRVFLINMPAYLVVYRLTIVTFTLQPNFIEIFMAPNKSNKAVDWAKSQVSTLMMDDLVSQGLLLAHEKIGRRVPEEETQLQPQQGEVIIFADHLQRGF